ncbi:MAG: HAMP domain-containing sensor histidine kinase [Caulobacteraceae bacterium]
MELSADLRPESAGAASIRHAAAQPTPAATLWHAGWALSAATAAAVLLLVIGEVPGRALTALALGAAPGAIGALWRRQGGPDQRLLLLAWTVGSAVAAVEAGGLTGQLSAWCLAPLLAGLVAGGWLRDAIVAAIASVVIVALAQAVGLAPPAQEGVVGFGLALTALITTVGGGATALVLAARREEDNRRDLAEIAADLGGVLTHLPYAALLVSAEGRYQKFFGARLPGFDPMNLDGGLIETAHVEDRPAVWTALHDATTTGEAAVNFRKRVAPDRWMALALKRVSSQRLVAIVREITEAAEAPSPPADDRRDLLLLESPGSAEQLLDLERRLAIAEDARIQAEDARSRADANARAKSRFLANMSHELRTPLNGIMGFSDVMRERIFGPMPEKYGEYAELIHESGRHLLDLINDVLDMSKIEADRYEMSREVFDARDAVSAALRLMRLQADDAKVQLRGILPPEPLTVDADKRALKQIVLNLVANALKFTMAEGSVTVTLQSADGAMELVVSDTGVGISEEDLKRLGRPFEQAGAAEDRAKGTGLGLSLVGAFAHMHGGEMTLESRLGEGTAVTVRLPVLVSPTEPAS